MFFISLPLLAPPSAPRIYLHTPADTLMGQWALLCLTGGFHPSQLTLTWTYQSTAASIDHLSVISYTIPAIKRNGNLCNGSPEGTLLSPDWTVNSERTCQTQCFQMMDNHSGESFLFSVFFLPPKQSLATGITLTCGVQDHPALTTAVTASFTWGKQANYNNNNNNGCRTDKWLRTNKPCYQVTFIWLLPSSHPRVVCTSEPLGALSPAPSAAATEQNNGLLIQNILRVTNAPNSHTVQTFITGSLRDTHTTYETLYDG